jgi:hypothetical protein
MTPALRRKKSPAEAGLGTGNAEGRSVPNAGLGEPA